MWSQDVEVAAQAKALQRLHNILGIVDVDEVVSELEPTVDAHKARRRAQRQTETTEKAVHDSQQQQRQQQQQQQQQPQPQPQAGSQSAL